MSATTPEAHARLSPSGAKKWFACPGSLAMEAPFPNKSNTYSDDGTAMHEVAAWCLTEHFRAAKRVGEWIVVSTPNEPVRKVQFDSEMAELTQDYVDYVRNRSVGGELHVEQRLSFSKFIADTSQFGTTDAGIVNWKQGELIVIDLKTGHRPVSVETNSQLSIYALAMLGELYEQAMTKYVIVQPVVEDDDEDLF